jgi:hypothetical protein
LPLEWRGRSNEVAASSLGDFVLVTHSNVGRGEISRLESVVTSMLSARTTPLSVTRATFLKQQPKIRRHLPVIFRDFIIDSSDFSLYRRQTLNHHLQVVRCSIHPTSVSFQAK